MSIRGFRALALEARDVVRTAREVLSETTVGPVVVSGMLAEQLARELASGAEPGAVNVGDGSMVRDAEVLVHVIAGEPSAADDALVRAADHRGVPVVLVQLWPQEDWTPPFVLAPFVVECRTGEGFPVREIADRIAEAAKHATALASRMPALKDAVSSRVTREAVARAAFLAVVGARKGAPARPVIAMEQIRMLSRLRVATTGSAESEKMPIVAGGAAVALASGFAFRNAARKAATVLPAPIANPAVAAAGTWALAKALQTLEARIPSA
jgi:hypothetical protein